MIIHVVDMCRFVLSAHPGMFQVAALNVWKVLANPLPQLQYMYRFPDLSNGTEVFVVLGLSAAFDTVNSKLLLFWLENCFVCWPIHVTVISFYSYLLRDSERLFLDIWPGWCYSQTIVGYSVLLSLLRRVEQSSAPAPLLVTLYRNPFCITAQRWRVKCQRNVDARQL